MMEWAKDTVIVKFINIRLLIQEYLRSYKSWEYWYDFNIVFVYINICVYPPLLYHFLTNGGHLYLYSKASQIKMISLWMRVHASIVKCGGVTSFRIKNHFWDIKKTEGSGRTCRQKEVFRSLNPKLGTLPLGSNAKNVSLSRAFIWYLHFGRFHRQVEMGRSWKCFSSTRSSFIYVFGIYLRVGFMQTRVR